ncbi:hypothetical protein RchiOBHm_Chr4g0422841 [Rosa chinensis]|uniref:Uncharacterized protein n=1 Tax=Rosa chinensis TaxID=74649 RepID=A0A2P6QYF4_ROSCH|nr:uncharacterized protein LOC112199458 [Rosa chinensis]PRQ39228.1 hypothetical protein RchiOBHm_Chr4g0422841 [Rosa chinensis]
MGKEVDKEEERKEAAIASTAVLQPNFKPRGITQDQLSKFQELHRKRLQIKSKSKFEKKPKAGTGKSHRKNHNPRDSTNEDSSVSVEDSAVPNSESHDNGSSSLPQQEDAPKKRQKLHWGLDTKERWERKANM